MVLGEGEANQGAKGGGCESESRDCECEHLWWKLNEMGGELIGREGG